ncbi:MAG: TatD family hydrolase [bacterium]
MEREFRPEPYITDSHHHLSDKKFNEDLGDVVIRAKERNVKILVEGGGLGRPYYLNNTSKLTERENMYYCVGIHPHSAIDFDREFIREIIELSNDDRFVGVGECGLDYYYNNSPRDIQKMVFKEHLKIAGKIEKPVVIHARNSYNDLFSIIEDEEIDGVKLLFHCFSGDDDDLSKVLKLGGYISIGGVITFPNAHKTRSILSKIPRDRLLLETDAPYISPQEYRGKRNEPAYIRYIGGKVAEIWSLPLEDVYYITTYNSRVFFGIDIDPGGDIVYEIGKRQYLNITNRCTNRCGFCVRNYSDGIGGYRLKLNAEPTLSEIIGALGDPRKYEEIVFCGFGEPLIRYEIVRDVSKYIKEKGGTVRVNTNGCAKLYTGVDTISYVSDVVDIFSISLNATDEINYNKICNPLFKNAYSEVLKSIERAKGLGKRVIVSFVSDSGVNLIDARRLAESLGVYMRFR